MMGKKHKKHKSERRLEEGERVEPLSLKLVLRKVDVQDSDSDVYSPAHERHKKHKKKKKKKKSSEKEKHRHHDEEKHKKRHHHEVDEEEEEEGDHMSASQEEEAQGPSTPKRKPVVEDLEEEVEEDTAEEKSDKDTMSPALKLSTNQEPEHGVIRICLKHLQEKLQRKDVNGFFAYPVNDLIAPGYSSIIQHPMDFSTMMSKINAHKYRSILEYKKDFVLMCQNAMTYNRPETIYYKEARRLFQCAVKLLSRDKLLHMKRTLPFMASLTLEEIGVSGEEIEETKEVIQAIAEEERMEKQRAKAREGIGKFEALPDNLTPEEILAQAKAAAKEAAEMLTLRRPTCDYAFLKQRKDGSTSMCIINPENDGILSENERVINLGNLIGKLASGTGQIIGVKEDKRNKVTPGAYMNYGLFSSYAPQYDSTFSNISKEESDLLLSTYGDETGVQYAQSLTNFIENCDDFATSMVDNLLDILTKGEHSKLKNQEMTDVGTDPKDPVAPAPVVKDPVQEKLDHTASLINDLQQTQYERLSSKLPPHLAQISGPSEKEIQLAQEITKEIKELAKKASPAAVVTTQAVRSAMGIQYQPSAPPTMPSHHASLQQQPANQMQGNNGTQEVGFSVNSGACFDSSDNNTSSGAPGNLMGVGTNGRGRGRESEEIDLSEFLQVPPQNQMDTS